VGVNVEAANLPDALEGPTNITLNCGEFPASCSEDRADKFAESLTERIRNQDANRHISFSRTPDYYVTALNMIDMESGNIGNPEPSPEKHIDQQQSTITNGTNQAGVTVVKLPTRGTNGGNLRLGKRHRSAALIPWVFDSRCWIRRYPSTVEAEVKERPDSLTFLADGSGGEVHRGDEVENVVSGDAGNASALNLFNRPFIDLDGRLSDAAKTAIGDVSLAAKIEAYLNAYGFNTVPWRGADGLVDEINGGSPVSGFKASADANSTGVAINPHWAIAGLKS
jgi:hypothetical protein